MGGLPARQAESLVRHPRLADALFQDDDDDQGRDEGQEGQFDAALRFTRLDVEVGKHQGGCWTIPQLQSHSLPQSHRH